MRWKMPPTKRRPTHSPREGAAWPRRDAPGFFCPKIWRGRFAAPDGTSRTNRRTAAFDQAAVRAWPPGRRYDETQPRHAEPTAGLNDVLYSFTQFIDRAHSFGRCVIGRHRPCTEEFGMFASIYFVSEAAVRNLKQRAERRVSGVRSAHMSEVVAAALGFRTHARCARHLTVATPPRPASQAMRVRYSGCGNWATTRLRICTCCRSWIAPTRRSGPIRCVSSVGCAGMVGAT